MHRDLGRRHPGDGLGCVAEAVGRVAGARAVSRAQRGRAPPRVRAGGEARRRWPRAGRCRSPRAARSRRSCRFGWPVGVTPAGRRACASSGPGRCIAALVVGVIVWGVMFWAMIFHRKREGDPDVPPRQTQYNLPLELIFTVVPPIIVAVLFGFTVQVQNYVDGGSAEPGPEGRRHRVPVELAVRLPRTATAPTGAPVTTIGTSRHDPAAGAADEPVASSSPSAPTT